MSQCFICEKSLKKPYAEKSYSVKLKKEGCVSYSCSYNCNKKLHEKYGNDFWEYVINKGDFVNPFKNENNNPFINIEKEVDVDYFKNIYDFNNEKCENNDIILNMDRYNAQYDIYLENKRIDEILDYSSSDYDSGDD
jgi:hypothetical protein